MIKNIVFDLGRVLLTFEPRAYLEGKYGPGEKADSLFHAIFRSGSWLDLDRGAIDEEQAFERMSPQTVYKEEVRHILYHWEELLLPMEPTIRIAERLKKQNKKLYILSNFHKRAYEKVSQNYPFFRLFDGILISAYTGLIKPDPEIYRILLRRFGLSPEECLFVDDTPENITAAAELGMEGILFHDAGRFENELIRMGILEKE